MEEIKLGKVISVANQKGGVGKTTTSVSLSAILAKKGKKVLMIDMDPQGNGTSGLGINKNVKFSVYDVIIDEVEIENTIQKAEIDNLDICPSNINLAGAEVELVDMEEREKRPLQSCNLQRPRISICIPSVRRPDSSYDSAISLPSCM